MRLEDSDVLKISLKNNTGTQSASSTIATISSDISSVRDILNPKAQSPQRNTPLLNSQPTQALPSDIALNGALGDELLGIRATMQRMQTPEVPLADKAPPLGLTVSQDSLPTKASDRDEIERIRTTMGLLQMPEYNKESATSDPDLSLLRSSIAQISEPPATLDELDTIRANLALAQATAEPASRGDAIPVSNLRFATLDTTTTKGTALPQGAPAKAVDKAGAIRS
jgi:hypothetical protein